jgi:UDP-N-acetylglucosamine--N-acetylmuramyl-(pentapeptide) pyrophosphoryl-undecaprenol N-acetylglucosamine transferase
MKLLIAGGGTGGHLFPGIAVAEELLRRGADHSVLFAGTDRGLEARVLPPLGLAFAPVRAAGLVGTGARRMGRALGLLLLGVWDAGRVLHRFRPTACLGVGGYVSFPVVALARLRGLPTAVQEQNAWPGVANRALARIVRRVYAGDPDAAAHLPRGKTRVTGNPLRRSLVAAMPYTPPPPGEPARVLVLGGSQGARALNEIVPAAVASCEVAMEVWHQAGRGHTGGVAAAYAGRSKARVVDFIEDMAEAYRWAHLVLCRSGALTVAELAAAGRPALLVPFPYSAGGHQEANARAAAGRGAALSVLEAELDADRLARDLEKLLTDPAQLTVMARAAAASARRDAAQAIVDDLLELERSDR